jgi:hypothetical protein
MCASSHLRLIPVAMLLAAAMAGLIIFSNTAAGLMYLAAAGLVVALLIFIATGVLSALAGFRRGAVDTAALRVNSTGAAIRFYGPIVLISAAVTIILAMLQLAGAFLAFPVGVVIGFGVVAALAFAIMLVYALAMFIYAARG